MSCKKTAGEVRLEIMKFISERAMQACEGASMTANKGVFGHFMMTCFGK